MRITLRKISSGLLLTLLATVVVVMGSSPTYAQSNTRSFQMALWTDPTQDANSDIAVFWGNQPQPAGRSIWVQGPLAYANDPLTWLSVIPNIDWSRIVAVEIDEPYTSVDGDLDQTCGDVNAANAAIAPIDATLQYTAEQLKALNPKARFWVNFTAAEGSWMGFCATPQVFNRAYIDVISDDYYDVGFDGFVSPFYAVLAQTLAKPDQQFALIPGVFSAPKNQGQYLQTYFDAANNMNQTCNLPLGDRGVTGYFDGCPVWIVLGFLSGNNTLPNGTLYVGLLDSRSAQIKSAWEGELALPLAPGLAHQLTPGQIVQAIIPPLLLNH